MSRADGADGDRIGTLSEVLLSLQTKAREQRNKRFTSLEPVSRTAASARFHGLHLPSLKIADNKEAACSRSNHTSADMKQRACAASHFPDIICAGAAERWADWHTRHWVSIKRITLFVSTHAHTRTQTLVQWVGLRLTSFRPTHHTQRIICNLQSHTVESRIIRAGEKEIRKIQGMMQMK